MHGINEELEFKPVRIAVLTVTDSRTRKDDTSGDLLAGRVEAAGHVLVDRDIVPDDQCAIKARVGQWLDDPVVDVIISTGGTGLTGRDVTPEAFRALYEKEIEGFSIIFHQVSFQTVGLSTLQSRATAGIAKGTILFALPGSNGAVRDGWDSIIVYELDSRHKPCNLVEMMPRLTEK